MPIMLWTNYFLEAQGYGHQDTLLYTVDYQDNQSAILLEKNVASPWREAILLAATSFIILLF
jgi:hypothetical protein